ncbi:hypothetical protein PHISCL_03166 [Aspergillus sclerotialis]|uniref:Uncharacterized protein n=1 Tax=Aspergillus sclerotialis TaxID=2070753 RepID=A0A3A2ZYN0_9EURO|nr:hypothetical protein PHISCL_03166 [Aspergillus sclerotialis]
MASFQEIPQDFVHGLDLNTQQGRVLGLLGWLRSIAGQALDSCGSLLRPYIRAKDHIKYLEGRLVAANVPFCRYDFSQDYNWFQEAGMDIEQLNHSFNFNSNYPDGLTVTPRRNLFDLLGLASKYEELLGQVGEELSQVGEKLGMVSDDLYSSQP